MTGAVRVRFCRAADPHFEPLDDHVHSLIGERFTAEVDHDRYFSVDFVALLDEESFQRAGVDVLAKSEAEFPVDLEEGIDDRRSNLAM